MDRMMSKEERKIRDADLLARSKATRLLWSSTENGTALKTRKGYAAKPPVQKRKATLTEAQDNAIGRKIRRRTNKALHGWRPYAQR